MAPRRIRSASSVPATAGAHAGWALGAAGLLPFFAAAAAMWAGYGRVGRLALLAPVALLAYAATIISFLGGVRWGFELSRTGGPSGRMLFGSVVPQIGAWGLLFAPMPAELRYGGLLILLLVQGGADAIAHDLPQWYRALRVPLTAGAAAAMLAGLVWALRLRHSA